MCLWDPWECLLDYFRKKKLSKENKSQQIILAELNDICKTTETTNSIIN